LRRFARASSGGHRFHAAPSGFHDVCIYRGLGLSWITLRSCRLKPLRSYHFHRKWNVQRSARAAGGTYLGEIILRHDVGNVERAVLPYPVKPWFINTGLGTGIRNRSKMSPQMRFTALVKSQDYVINSTNPCGALDDRVQYRLHIGGRAADDAKHLGGVAV
jgi:hypothetical protein